MNAVVAPPKPVGYGAKVLVLGDTGDGKTHSIRTLVSAGLEVFVLFTENGMASLRDTDPEQVHWKYIPPKQSDLQSLINMSRNINQLSYKQIAALQDANRNKYTQFVDTLVAMSNFTCDRTGKSYGSVDSWGRDKVFVLDSISGTAINALTLITGDAPMRDPGEIGIAMGRIETLIQHLCFSTKCHVVCIGHVEREEDQLAGGGATAIKIAVPGKKLAPKIPWFFDDVLYARRVSKNWTWTTDYPGVIGLKSRHLGVQAVLPQDFGPIIRENAKLVESATQQPTTK